jgi:hypothetical protein
LFSTSFDLSFVVEGDLVMRGCARLLSRTHNIAKKSGGVYRWLGKKIKERYSRQSKPTAHLGNKDFEERFPSRVDYVRYHCPFNNEDRYINIWPQKDGTSHEDMEVGIGEIASRR